MEVSALSSENVPHTTPKKMNILALICWINYFSSSIELLFEYSYFVELAMTAVH